MKKKMKHRTIMLTILVLCLVCIVPPLQVEAQPRRLAAAEREVLLEIGLQLGKRGWNLDADPCNDSDTTWSTDYGYEPLYSNAVVCNCSYPDGICHVVNIILKGQDLAGKLPSSIAKLPYLVAIDFTRNYLTGNIPSEWASTKLENLSIAVNNLSGPIPAFLGNITTLVYMSLENNMFSGTVPVELGNLVSLRFLILNANSLTGELPVVLTNLTHLQHLRISSNNFTGKIPDFSRSWNQLMRLEIQASGLQGPIPSSISILSNLTDLRISDLRGGGGSVFPDFNNMTNLRTLMLRSCNLSGHIPDLSALTQLRTLDLSFNKLEGSILDREDLLPGKLEFLYLTSNLLSGSIPEWIKSRVYPEVVDVSYNNFSQSSEPVCIENLNVFKSSSVPKNSLSGACLDQFPCTEDQYSLHINCGGKATTIEGINFEADQDPGGPAHFAPSRPSWGFSSTGHFLDDSIFSDAYIANNISVLEMAYPELYTHARLSPLSLTYYARCLANGNYNVKLYFSEIIIRGDASFYSLGRRIFDVYIQDKHVLKDFDIKERAGGVDKVVIRDFPVEVKDKTLEIRFHWSGKGTIASPRRGVYGPLISAISVNFDPSQVPNSGSAPADSSATADSKKKVLIAVAASAGGLVFLILGILWWKGFLDSMTSRGKACRGLDLQKGFFTFKQIKAATNNFDLANKIGEGGFGSVYKGILLDGTIVAVKQLSSKSKQGNREFVNEIGMISGLQHPNLVRLYGSCTEANELLLVYEYMENNSLAHALFGPEEGPARLDWHTRQRICIGIAKGLAFLHEESALKVVHRDIKTTNVLLDKDLNAKISDFGLAKLDEEENTHISTRVAGTIGYMAPEYALWGYLTFKADVFSFGVVGLEIVAGKNNMKFRPNENFVGLVDWALVLQQKESLVELVDPRLGSDFSEEEAVRMVKVALLCINPTAALRPNMSAVVSMLEGRIPVDELSMDPSIYSEEMRLTALRNPFEQIVEESAGGGTKSLIHSSDASWNGSSAPTTSSDL